MGVDSSKATQWEIQTKEFSRNKPQGTLKMENLLEEMRKDLEVYCVSHQTLVGL